MIRLKFVLLKLESSRTEIKPVWKNFKFSVNKFLLTNCVHCMNTMIEICLKIGCTTNLKAFIK